MKAQNGSIVGRRCLQWGLEAKIELWRVRMPVVAGLHHFAEDPDPQHSERSDPDLHQCEMSDPDLYQCEMSDPYPHQTERSDTGTDLYKM
jgi:hypothetical protein